MAAAKRPPGPPAPGNVVKEIKIGNTLIQFCDDSYRDKTPEEIRQCLRNLDKVASDGIRNKLIQEKLREEEAS